MGKTLGPRRFWGATCGYRESIACDSDSCWAISVVRLKALTPSSVTASPQICSHFTVWEIYYLIQCWSCSWLYSNYKKQFKKEYIMRYKTYFKLSSCSKKPQSNLPYWKHTWFSLIHTNLTELLYLWPFHIPLYPPFSFSLNIQPCYHPCFLFPPSHSLLFFQSMRMGLERLRNPSPG